MSHILQVLHWRMTTGVKFSLGWLIQRHTHPLNYGLEHSSDKGEHHMPPLYLILVWVRGWVCFSFLLSADTLLAEGKKRLPHFTVLLLGESLEEFSNIKGVSSVPLWGEEENWKTLTLGVKLVLTCFSTTFRNSSGCSLAFLMAARTFSRFISPRTLSS